LKPNIIISYIAQTDLGDEYYRYKDYTRTLLDKNDFISLRVSPYTKSDIHFGFNQSSLSDIYRLKFASFILSFK